MPAPGLAVPVVIQPGEEVLTRTNRRHLAQSKKWGNWFQPREEASKRASILRNTLLIIDRFSLLLNETKKRHIHLYVKD